MGDSDVMHLSYVAQVARQLGGTLRLGIPSASLGVSFFL
jgi:hypothetical protein